VIEKFPNIAEIFELFPYVMYYNGLSTESISAKEMHEFKYSYPLGNG
jgi:hypothetical protein